MLKYITLAEELDALPQERQKSIEARADQIRLEEITEGRAESPRLQAWG